MEFFIFSNFSFSANFCLDQFVDSVYASKAYYLLEKNSGIWRKEIDKMKPGLWMGFESGEGMGKLLTTALHGEALIINKNEFKILGVLIDTMGNKLQELEIESSSYYGYKSHTVLGKDRDVIACLRMDGFLSLQSLNFDQKRVTCLLDYKIEILEDRSEFAHEIEVCSQGRNMAVSTFYKVQSSKIELGSSRILIFGLSPDMRDLQQLQCLDVYEEKVMYFSGKFFGYFEDTILLNFFTLNKALSKSKMVCYRFDAKSKGVVSVREEALVDGMQFVKIMRFKDCLVTSDLKGRIVRIKKLAA